jgi:hypothetical protein
MLESDYDPHRQHQQLILVSALHTLKRGDGPLSTSSYVAAIREKHGLKLEPFRRPRMTNEHAPLTPDAHRHFWGISVPELTELWYL